MMNSWVNFLTWIAVLLLAIKCQISATELTNLITTRNLTSHEEEHKIKFKFGVLFVLSAINFVAYNIFCLTFGDANTLRSRQTIFVSFSTVYLGILTLAFAYSLNELSKAIQQTDGI
jgi:formate-dependent nitrite reductase membrane component NrfD